MKVTEKLASSITYFDGGMGSLLISRGLEAGENSALWNLTHPEIIADIHRAYIEAGCDVITSNTFGANPYKTDGYASCIKEGLKIARNAALSCKDRKIYVAFDIGPGGRLLKPFGDLDFEDAVAFYKKIVSCADENADFILFETFSDCIETKAAVIAAKECSSLPIFVSNSYDEGGRLLTGSGPEAMAAMLEGLSVDAIGVNCSQGPEKMAQVAARLCASTSLPVFASPNAGLPRVADGITLYDLGPEEFALSLSRFIDLGVNGIGGCCGTTPEHIKALVEMTSNRRPQNRITPQKCVVSSWAHALELGAQPIIIGERLNPTGKPKLKEALKNADYDYLISEAIAQQDAGAHILDLNVGLPVIDEKTVMPEAMSRIQAVCPLPLQIDTVDTEALERALRLYVGKPLINSVNGKKESMESVLPLAAKYGGAVIALTLDENGIPDNARARADIAARIVKKAEEYGISSKNIIVDPLALAISSDPSSARVTLEAIELIKRELGVCVSLGVSNVSFGLPSRDLINSTFYAAALERGLDLAIINPLSDDMMKTYRAYCALKGFDAGFASYIDFASNRTEATVAVKAVNGAVRSDISGSDLYVAVVNGTCGIALEQTSRLMAEGALPLDVINRDIIPALELVGKEFEEKRMFLPQLLNSAECAKQVFELLKGHLESKASEGKGKIVIATVKGDLHDIGKNIVKTVLESYGFEVIDLGKDVAPADVLEAVQSSGATLVGLSALMTTTVPSMKETISLIREHLPETFVMVGGAVLNEECAALIGADAYAPDAMAAVRIASSHYSI